MSQQVQAITQALAAEFAAVAESMVGAPVQTSPLADQIEVGWVVACSVDGPVSGTWSIGFTRQESASLAERVLLSSTVAESEIADALVEIAGQMLAALITKQAIDGLSGKVTGARVGSALPGRPAGGFACRFDDALTLHVACAFDGTEAAARAPLPAAADAAPSRDGGPRPAPDNLELILDIDMPLSVRFGEATMTLDALSRLGPGSLIELSRQPDDPVDVLINGRLVARGEVVVVSGNYGVRIMEVVSAAERIRTINA